METMMPTSFIPKRPVSSETLTPKKSSRSMGLLSLLAWIVVIATVVSYVGVIFYHKQLINQKIKIDALTDEARKSIGTTFLSDMKRLNSRIDSAKATIDRHIVVTPIFNALEQTTLRSIQYTSFGYEFVQDTNTSATNVKVSLTGVAKGYSTLALQSDSFLQNSLIKNPVFSNLDVEDKNNNVKFKLTFNVDPANLSYESFINGTTQNMSTGSTEGTPITTIIQ